LSTGTAVLVAPERMLTNAHVLWPQDSVRLVFPDGREVERARVLVQDALRDLALIEAPGIGTSKDSVAPLPLADAQDLPIGAPVYLVGYPAEMELFPQPAITRGILSLRRHWDAGDLTYLQTDAAIAGGQSGGALVDGEGRMIGVSGLIFGEGGFALAADATAALAHLARIESGRDEAASEALRVLPREASQAGAPQRSNQRVNLSEPFAEASFVFYPEFGEEVEVEASPGAGVDVFLELLSPYGDLELEADEQGAAGVEQGRFTALSSGPHVLVIGRVDGNASGGNVPVEASQPLLRLDDPDDGRRLEPGEGIVASLDHPGDIDTFELRTTGEQEVVITVDTANFVPDLLLEPLDGDEDAPLIPGATGEGNALGLASRAVLPAGGAARWSVRIADMDGVAQGGYFLHVEAR
jgi:hypothetical protein